MFSLGAIYKKSLEQLTKKRLDGEALLKDNPTSYNVLDK